MKMRELEKTSPLVERIIDMLGRRIVHEEAAR